MQENAKKCKKVQESAKKCEKMRAGGPWLVPRGQKTEGRGRKTDARKMVSGELVKWWLLK